METVDWIHVCFVLKISHAKTTSSHQYTLGQSVLKELKSHSYLGVNISHDLKWVDHINSTISKANRVLGVICRNFHSCPTELKATAYNSGRLYRGKKGVMFQIS